MNKLKELLLCHLNLYYWRSLIMMVCSSFILASCSGERCIDADDFGFDKFTISSRYSSDALSQQQQGNQIAPWVDSGFTVNGRPLSILVRTWEYGEDKNNSGELSAWCPWFGNEGNEHKLSKFCERLQECIFLGGLCSDSKNASINNAPCLLKNGIGLYGLIATLGSNPNVNFTTQRNPDGLTFHLGDAQPASSYALYDYSKLGILRKAGGIIYQYQEAGQDSAAIKQQYAGGNLYFKILDKFYDDNNGQYRIVIKSGVNNSRPDPIEFLTKLVKDNLFGTEGNYGIIRNIYLGITQNPAYRSAVAAILSLYIMFSAFSFLTGNLNITHTELIVRVVKISIISALLSSRYSWTFFNDYLFTYFVGGVEQILQIIKEAGASGPGAASILSLMIAPQTMAKLFSLLFIDWQGFIYILLFLIAFLFLFKLLFEASVIYLAALISIGIIITMAPIFICFLLFQITRSLFENWLRQLISYALQPIILFTGLIFISMIIRSEIYSSLGFRVCKHDFLNLGGIQDIIVSTVAPDDSLVNSLFYWWFPMPMRGEDFTQAQAVIPVPEDFFKDDGSFCEAYGCLEKRYLELPFLDPIKDTRRINNFFQGHFVQLDGLWLIFIALYLLSKFNSFSTSVAKFIAGSSGNLTDIKSASDAAISSMGTAMTTAANKPISNLREQFARRITRPISTTIAGVYEEKMINSLRKDAMSSRANKAVLDEIKRNYGMDHKDLNQKAMDEYVEVLKAKIKAVEPKITDNEAERKAHELAQKDYKELDKKFQDPKLKLLASDVKFAEDFQKAYVDTHQAMSARGVGFFGKRISILRDFQELDTRMKETEHFKESKRRAIGEKLYASYEGMKRKVITEVAGEKVRDALGVGAEWHDFDYNDPALRTYNEQLKDKKNAMTYRELQREIDKETVGKGIDVLKPEYHAELQSQGRSQELAYYQELANKKLSYEIHGALSGGEDPALMGEKFMREKATDSQLKHTIDRAYEIEQELVKNDRYIRREDYYEAIHEVAIEDITSKHKMLTSHFKRNDIKPEELPTLLQEYHKSKGSSNEEVVKAVEDLSNSMKDFEYSKKALEKIDQRKEFIKTEVEGHVDSINQIRENAQMSKYTKTIESKPREFKTLEQHLRT